MTRNDMAFLVGLGVLLIGGVMHEVYTCAMGFFAIALAYVAAPK